MKIRTDREHIFYKVIPCQVIQPEELSRSPFHSRNFLILEANNLPMKIIINNIFQNKTKTLP